MNIGGFSVKNRVLINILMVSLLVFGVFSLTRMPREQFAEVPFYWVTILVPVPGYSAEDVEKQVLVPIEREMNNLDKLDEIRSEASEGLGFVRIGFVDGINDDEFQRLYQKVQTRFDRVELPDEALDPILDDFSSNDFLPVIEVVVHGQADWALLQDTADRLEDDLLGINDVSDIGKVGYREQQIVVLADPSRLENFGIPLTEVVSSLQQQNVNIPAGRVGGTRQEYLVRTTGESVSMDDFRRVVIENRGQGGVVYLGDLAEVNRRFDPDIPDSRYNGQKAIILQVLKLPGGDSVRIIEAVKERIAGEEGRLPDGLALTLTGDSTIQIRRSLNILITNALFGLALVIVILFVFIGLRNSLITALGIPVTFALTFVILDLMGETFNGNTLFALVLVLGLIVDHAIVITENSHRLRLSGLSRTEAAIQGTNQVVIPVFAATATTVAAFIPLMLLPGTLGKFLRVIPLTVTIALIASTFEAVIFLPAHYAEWPGGRNPRKESAFFHKSRDVFRKLLDKLYNKKGLTVLVTLVVMVLLLMLTPLLKQDLFSGEDYTYFYIDVEMPPGTPKERTADYIGQFEERLLPLVGNGEIIGVSAVIGAQEASAVNATSGNLARLTVDLAEREQGRKRSIAVIMSDIQVMTADIPGAERVEFRKQQNGPPVDPPVSFRLFGDSYSELAEVSRAIRNRLATYDELFNIKDNYQQGQPEIRISVNSERAAFYGLSTAWIATNLRSLLDGITATTFFRDNEEIDVLVFSGTGEMKPEELEQIVFVTPDGRRIPFGAVCRLEYDNSAASIKRLDGKREITISAEAFNKDNIQDINKAMEEYFETGFSYRFPDVEFVVGGEFAEFNNLLIQILRIFLVGVFLIYVILGTQFKSYTQPFLILFAVPLAFAGVILFLFISGTPFSTTVLYAAVALAGIAVNDAIVLISFINEQRQEGKSVAVAIKEATATRFRPILLTSLTTIAGLFPTAVGLGGRSPVWGPMAGTIIFGLLFSTITALIFVPCLYGLFFDRKKKAAA